MTPSLMLTPASGDMTAGGNEMGTGNGVINFPNPSRIHDTSRHCVCFWGYDNAREIAFLVDDAMLAKLSLVRVWMSPSCSQSSTAIATGLWD